MPALQPQPPRRRRSWLAAGGAWAAAAAVALSAYAAHAAAGTAQSQLQTAALFAFGHGVALAALVRAQDSALARLGLVLLWWGLLLFSGSLAMAALAQWPTTMAPLGGTLLILGWILYAADRLRR